MPEHPSMEGLRAAVELRLADTVCECVTGFLSCPRCDTKAALQAQADYLREHPDVLLRADGLVRAEHPHGHSRGGGPFIRDYHLVPVEES